MSFDDALNLAMYHGKRIRRKDWGEDIYCCKWHGKLVYRFHDDFTGKLLALKFVDSDTRVEDMLANDWEEVKG